MSDFRSVIRKNLALGASLAALGVSQQAIGQSLCGDGSVGPVCTIDNIGSIGPITGTSGTATIVNNSGTITGAPAISQGQSVALYINNESTGVIEGPIQGNSLFLFGIENSGTINGSVVVSESSTILFSSTSISYIADGGTVDGAVTLGGSGYSTANFIQRGADDGVSGSITAGNGLDIYTKSYDVTQSVAMGQYTLPTTFELEGYEVLGTDTALTLTGTGETIILLGDGHVVNAGEINLVDTSTVYPVEVVPAAVSTYNQGFATYQRQSPQPGQPLFYTIPIGNELASFTNDGTINGDVRIASASFTNNGDINLLSHAPGTVIRSAADQDFVFRNDGSIVLTDNGARPAYTGYEAEFEDGIGTAVRLTTAVNASGLNAVTIENGSGALISGGLSFSGVTSSFTFVNEGEIEIGDNPFEIDRAVDFSNVDFDIAQNPALQEDAVADSVTLVNNGTLDGGIEAEFATRVMTFTNTGLINADVTDPYASAINLFVDDWASTPGGDDINDAELLTFVNSTSGTIVGSVEVEANASLISITNDGSITQGLRPGHGVFVGSLANSDPTGTFVIDQATTLDSEITFANTGTIGNADYAGEAVFIEVEAGDIGSGVSGAAEADAVVTVINSGSIVSSGGNYLNFPPSAGLTTGQIGIDYNMALTIVADAEGTASASITNDQGGLINAQGPAHYWNGSTIVEIPNQPSDSGGMAIAVAGMNYVTVVNEGVIRGGPGGSLTLPDGGTLVPIDTNLDFEGVWGGAIDTFGQSADSITNTATGVIEGSVALRSGNDRFENYGIVDGNLYLGAGDDTFVQGWQATVTGIADGGDGIDTFILDLDGSTSGDTIDLAIYDQLVSFELLQTQGTGGGVTGGSGDDNVNNTGTLNGTVDLGEGDNQFTNSTGGTINDDVIAGTGDDTVANEGTINGDVNLGDGANEFANVEGATINGDVITGSGSDAVANEGTIDGSIDLGDGDNEFANSEGGTITGDVQTGTGDDAIQNAGTIEGDIVLDGEGGSALTTMRARIAQTSLAESVSAPTGGDDILVNDGDIAGSIFAGGGDDIITNTGSVGGSIDLGDGDDILNLAGDWSIGGGVNGGAGSDVVGITFADAPADGEVPLMDLSLFSGIEKFDVNGGTGKIGGEATFEEINVNLGRLIGAAESVITAEVYVGNGGTFGSAGTIIGDIAVASGGELSPGASPAVMHVVGDVSLAGGSVTTFEFVPAPGQSDQLIIDGNLAIASGAVLNVEGERPLTPGTAYDMIVADEIDGEFTLGTWDHSAVAGFLRYVDGTTEDRLQLMGTFLAAEDASPQIANGIDYVNALLISGEANSALLGSIPALLDANGYASSAAFALVSPEPYATASQLGVENGLGMTKTFRNDIAVPAQNETALFAFGTVIGNWRSLSANGDTGTSRGKSESVGFIGGLGFGSEVGSVAAFAGYLDGKQKIRSLTASTKADGLVAGLTGHVAAGGVNLNALVSYDWSEATTARAVPGGSVVSSKYALRTLTLDASAAYSMALTKAWAIEPEFGITHISNRRGAALETGSAAFILEIERERTKATFADASLVMRGGREENSAIRPFARIGVRHQLDGENVYASGRFAGMTTSFTVPGAARKKTVVTAGAGLAAEISSGFRIFAAYEGEFGGGTGTFLNAGLRIGF